MSGATYYPDRKPGFDEYPEGNVACKFCGEPGLEWVNTGVRWVLVDERARKHECRGKVASAEDFSE